MSIPQDVVLVSPRLSFSPRLWHHDSNHPSDFTLDEWFAAYSWKDPGSPNAEGRVSLWRVFSYEGATVYWQ